MNKLKPLALVSDVYNRQVLVDHNTAPLYIFLDKSDTYSETLVSTDRFPWWRYRMDFIFLTTDALIGMAIRG